MVVGHKNGHTLKKNLAQAYRRYQICWKAIDASHGYGVSLNHVHETDAQMMTAYALQAFANETMEDKEAMENLTSINIKLSQSLNQVQEATLVLSKHLRTIQA